MSFDTSWNIDKYKSDFESEEHWELRKNFMLANKEKFSEERLVCLAQVFFNVEFLGCKYPEKTMKLVEELSKDVAAEHRESQKTKLQRTFVKASDAAGARIKGIKRDAESNSNIKANDDKSNSRRSDTNQTCRNDESQFVHDTLGNRYERSQSAFQEKHPRLDDGYNNWNKSKHNITLDEIRRTTGPCGNIVVFFKEGDGPLCTLQKTAHEWRKEYRCDFVQDNYLWTARIMFDGVELSSSSDAIKAVARKQAAQLAVDKLMRSYFTVKIKSAFFGGDEVIKKSGKERINESEQEDGHHATTLDSSSENSISDKKNERESVTSSSNATDVDTPLEDSNVGLKLLKMMGWSGGGLGKNQQGISEPIKPSSLGKSRAGFGSKVKNNVIKEKSGENLFPIKEIIREYKFSSNFHDLVFSPEFTKEQRSVLHKYAQRLGLKTKSFGGKSEENRHLVIFKRIDNWTIIDGLVKNVDQFYSKYELLRPGEHTDANG